MYAIPNLQDYLKFVTINFGMDSVIVSRTPREIIEGYNDKILQRIHDANPYTGGDKSLDPFVNAASPSSLFPANNTVMLLSGEDNHGLKRSLVKWNNQSSSTIPYSFYNVTNSLV